MIAQEVFQRYEKKYLLTSAAHERFMQALSGQVAADQYGLHTILSLYYDTVDFALIRASIEKPVYKEKLRLRSYGTPGQEDAVYVELKKKCEGIVYKRRTPLPLYAAEAYLNRGQAPARGGQVLREIDWVRGRYRLAPKALLAYDREAFLGREDPLLRITFDRNIRFRLGNLRLSAGSYGTPLLPEDRVLMEVKFLGAMPLWLTRMLSEQAVFPTSFSKYGNCYREHLLPEFVNKEGMTYAS